MNVKKGDHWLRASGPAFAVALLIVVIAGGTAAVDATTFKLTAQLGSPTYGIAENLYLSKAASSTDYAVTIEAHADGTWSYDEVTTLRMKELAEPFLHTDHNRLHRAG